MRQRGVQQTHGHAVTDEVFEILRTVSRLGPGDLAIEGRVPVLDAVPSPLLVLSSDGTVRASNAAASAASAPRALSDVVVPTDAARILRADPSDDVTVLPRVRLTTGELREAWILVQRARGVRYLLLREPIPRQEREMPRATAGANARGHSPSGTVGDLPVVVYEARVGRQWRLTSISPCITDLTGDEPRRWLADPSWWWQRIADADRDLVTRSRATARRIGHGSVEYHLMPRQGGCRRVEDRFVVRGNQAYGVLIDVTDRSEMAAVQHELLQHAVDLLERMTILASARETAVQVFAHDVRSPLSLVASLLETLDPDEAPGGRLIGADEDQNRRLLRLVSRGVQSTLDVVGCITHFLELEHGAVDVRCDEVDLHAVVQRAVDRAGPAHVFVSTPPEGTIVKGDAVMLERAVANLLLNAITYAPDEPVEVSITRDARSATVHVADRGPGVPKEMQELIFQPFCRSAAPDRGGLGLGLALVDRIARMHGGSVWVQNRHRGGARFGLSLVRAEQALTRETGPGTPRGSTAVAVPAGLPGG